MNYISALEITAIWCTFVLVEAWENICTGLFNQCKQQCIPTSGFRGMGLGEEGNMRVVAGRKESGDCHRNTNSTSEVHKYQQWKKEQNTISRTWSLMTTYLHGVTLIVCYFWEMSQGNERMVRIVTVTFQWTTVIRPCGITSLWMLISPHAVNTMSNVQCCFTIDVISARSWTCLLVQPQETTTTTTTTTTKTTTIETSDLYPPYLHIMLYRLDE